MSLAENPGNKETEIGWIPDNWIPAQLGSVASARKTKDVAKEGLPCIELEHIESESGRLLGWDNSGTQASIKTAFAKDDVLFGKLRPYLRKYAVAPFDGICTTEILAIHPTADRVNKRFLFYLMQGGGVFATVNALSYGTKMPRVSWTDLSEITIALPPQLEQQKIADMLAAVDDKLDVIAHQINASQTLKHGLMQTLFSRGVGSQHATDRWVPHSAFKDSELGEIPSSWQVMAIGDAFAVIERPIKMADKQVYSRVTVKRRHGGVELRDELPGAKIKVKNQFLLKTGDFLISERQIVHGACGIVPAPLEGALVSNEYLVLVARDGFDTNYFNYLVQQLKYAKLFLLCSQGVDIEKFLFKADDWLKKRIPVPPLAEQQRIVEILSAIESKLASLERKYSEYQTLKRGLMQKLLTGEWRVKLDTEPAPV